MISVVDGVRSLEPGSCSSMLRLFRPDLRIYRVEQLTVEQVGAMGLDALLLDADCTLKRYPCEDCSPSVRDWIDSLRQGGVRLCIVSNGYSDRISRFANTLGLPFVGRALKPLPFGCHRAMRQIGANPERTAIAGDQVFADIMAGRLAGIRTILVEPIHPEEERWFTRLKRGPERWILSGMDRP